jgi:ethanolamine permease
MFVGLCYSVAEMSAAMPHAGGGYSFARSAMGPLGGLAAGLSATAEYVLLPAILVIAIGRYAGSVAENWFGLSVPEPVWWALFYVLFVALNIWSIELSFRVALVLTTVAIAILALFVLGGIPWFSWDMVFAGASGEGAGRLLPDDFSGLAWALPFAVWFFLAVEEVPLAAEETVEPDAQIPKGILRALLTLIATGFLILFVNSGIPPGARAIGSSFEPLIQGFRTIFGPGFSESVLSLMMLVGMLAGFHAIMFAYGRNIYALGRAGYFPHWMSLTHPRRKTPHVALIVGAVIGYAAALAIHLMDPATWTAKVLLYMAIYGAIISCAVHCLSFILLRKRLPDMRRPFRSPLGVPGAATALAICLVILVVLTADPEFRSGAIGMAIWYLLGLAYFYFRGGRALVRSPEEEFAIRERGEAAG